MRTIQITLLWLAALCCPANAQITESQNAYRNGDAVKKQQVNRASISRNHDGMMADLSRMEVTGNDLAMKVMAAGGDSTTVYENRMRLDYRQTDDSLLFIGSESHLLRMVYDRAEPCLCFPFAVGDSIGGIYSGRGAYCEKLFLHTFGTYKTVADRMGSLRMPGGDTLRNVVRLRTERTASTLYLPLDSMTERHGTLQRVPSLSPEHIKAYMQTDTCMALITIHRYYAQGFRYPVLEETVVKDMKGNVMEAASYYCAPEEQALLTDVENERLRQWSGGDGTEDVAYRQSEKNDSSFRYMLRHESRGGRVSVEYSSAHGTVRMLLCDRDGIVYRQAESTEPSGILTVNCNGLRRGQYVVYVRAGSEQYSEKIDIR